jgi:drug/metabolite transporter (DMT)-like permease
LEGFLGGVVVMRGSNCQLICVLAGQVNSWRSWRLWQGWGFDFGRVTTGGWLTLVYMAVFPSVVCYLIYYHALSKISASRVSAFSYSQPLIATLTGFVALGEPVTGAVALGGVLVLSGVWTTSRG